MDRHAKKEFQAKVLDLVTTFVVLGLCWTKPQFLNPWELLWWQWGFGFLVKRCMIFFFDYLVVFVIDKICHFPLLPTRTATTIAAKPIRYVELDTKSILYLTINALHEWIFVQRLLHYIWYSPLVSLQWQDVGFWNTMGALCIMFVVLDALYAPCHHILHFPSIYPLIHKHHHRQHYPTRGYLDAGNEHPIEHVVGVLSTWGAVLAAVHGPTGGHGFTIFFFFNIHAALAMLNHSPYNVDVDILKILPGINKHCNGDGSGSGGSIFQYSVGNHEMHHRKFTINYAQYCMWYDHIMKTYGSYEGPTIHSNKREL